MSRWGDAGRDAVVVGRRPPGRRRHDLLARVSGHGVGAPGEVETFCPGWWRLGPGATSPVGEGRTTEAMTEPKAVPQAIGERLRCPSCGGSMAVDGEGASCGTGHRFPWRDGYLDFSSAGARSGSTEQTFESFGFEWNEFDDVRDEDEAFAEVYFRDVDLGGLAGKVGLDAGCGKGRYTRVLARHLGALAALDGSVAARAAARNLAGADNVVVVRSDLRTAPFGEGVFDFVSSLGVLHHLDDPREGFRQLLRHLAPGGQVLVYLYSRPDEHNLRWAALAAATATRKLTVRLPHRTLRVLAGPIATALYVGTVMPGQWGERRGIAALAGLPMGSYRGKPLRSLVLDTFDRLSAPVEHRYVWRELEPWFTDEGLVVDSARDEAGWFVLAHRR